MISGDDLATFIALVEQRHFVYAGDSLGIAQSVVSKRLKRLEDSLGMTLIDRTNRFNLKLTRGGELFLPAARTSLSELEKAMRVGRGLARGIAGPIRVGYVFSAAMTGVLSKVASVIKTRCPEMELVVTQMGTSHQIKALESALLDIGIMRPRHSYPTGLISNVVHEEGYVLALAETHPFNNGEPICVADMGNPLFLIPQHPQDQSIAFALKRIARRHPSFKPSFNTVEDFVSALSLAAAGVGVTLAPRSLSQFKIDGLVFCEISDILPKVKLLLLQRPDAPREATTLLNEAFSSF